ncbi:hypothetical protein [Paenibacillus daejeonensis]|uniref:hypothetical protein n=1 Tax=Paenibacillus daejeonensis TaxID=135193 RepID=UPI001FE0D867|nr:hypothetical protein [Paenibacillus daejeonensis]
MSQEKLSHPRLHSKWLQPHSHAWYAQLGRLTGRYEWNWQSTITEPNGETMFEREVAGAVPGKRVLMWAAAMASSP